MNHARHEFAHLVIAQLKAGASPELAVAGAVNVVRALDERFGKEEPEPSVADQIAGLFSKLADDAFLKAVFAGIPMTDTPPDTRGTVDTEKPPEDKPATSKPRWR